MPNAISANNFLVAGVPGLTPLISAGRTAHLHSPGQLDWMQRRTKLLPPSEGSRDLGSACCRRTDETMGRGDLVTQLAELAIQNTASKIGSSALYGCPSLPNSPIVQWEEAKTEYARDQSDVTKFKTVIYVWSQTYSHRSKTRPRGPARTSWITNIVLKFVLQKMIGHSFLMENFLCIVIEKHSQ